MIWPIKFFFRATSLRDGEDQEPNKGVYKGYANQVSLMTQHSGTTHGEFRTKFNWDVGVKGVKGVNWLGPLLLLDHVGDLGEGVWNLWGN